MKNIILLIVTVMAFSLISIYVILNNENSLDKQTKLENIKYEHYLEKTITGSEVTSIINQAINQNEKNNIEKDKNNYYIENDKNSISVIIKMTSIEKEFKMEELYNKDITLFVQNFNIIQFKCSEIEYHNTTNKIKRIIIEEIVY